MVMVKLAINGMGRIGRCVLRAAQDTNDITVTAVNDRHAPEDIAYHYNYDSVHGEPDKKAQETQKSLQIGDQNIAAYQKENPEDIPWNDHDVDLVLEATGVFRHKEDAARHLDAGADNVLISAPAKGEQADTIPSIVYGVNNDAYNGESIVDCASCTTNSLAPMAKALHDTFGIKSGLLTTVHAYTGSQVLVDGVKSKRRRGRAAAENIVPTTTGAADAVTDVLPELDGRLDGMAMRVPVPNGSISDFSVALQDDVTAEQINNELQAYATNKMNGVLGYTDEEVVSQDIIGNQHSALIDGQSTRVRGQQAKVLGWYDNEYGYASRMLDVARLVT